MLLSGNRLLSSLLSNPYSRLASANLKSELTVSGSIVSSLDKVTFRSGKVPTIYGEERAILSSPHFRSRSVTKKDL